MRRHGSIEVYESRYETNASEAHCFEHGQGLKESVQIFNTRIGGSHRVCWVATIDTSLMMDLCEGFQSLSLVNR